MKSYPHSLVRSAGLIAWCRSFATGLLALSLGASLASAAIYYVSTSGSDSNNGTATGTPWKTLNKVKISSFSPGDHIQFKRGDTWIGEGLVARLSD